MSKSINEDDLTLYFEKNGSPGPYSPRTAAAMLIAAMRAARAANAKLVTLKLTEDQADTLFCVMTRIGGSSDNSPREHTISVQQMLYDAGVRGQDYPALPDCGAIHFKNYDGSTRGRGF